MDHSSDPIFFKNMDGGLTNAEFFWRDHYRFLEEKGYKLRSRYSPDWTPSWLNTRRHRLDCEDAYGPLVRRALLNVFFICSGDSLQRMEAVQATRISDGRVVVLKQIWMEQTPTEAEITRYFSNEDIASDPENHSVPLYDVLQSPIYKVEFLVLPCLMRINEIKFATIGEVVECFRQIFEVCPISSAS